MLCGLASLKFARRAVVFALRVGKMDLMSMLSIITTWSLLRINELPLPETCLHENAGGCMMRVSLHVYRAGHVWACASPSSRSSQAYGITRLVLHEFFSLHSRCITAAQPLHTYSTFAAHSLHSYCTVTAH